MINRIKLIGVFLGLLLGVLLSACSTVAAPSPTLTVLPSATSVLTATPAPTETPIPTETSEPTPVPTATTEPSPTTSVNSNNESDCPVSADDTYGYEEGNPIRVGGDFFNGAAREREYLDTLRGPRVRQ